METAITSATFAPIMTELTEILTVSSLVEVLAYIAGIAAGFIFLWWGVRKAAKGIMAAFQHGSLRI